MRRSIWFTVLTATLSMGATAGDGVELRTKALASAYAGGSVGTNYAKPESTAYARDPFTALVQHEMPIGSTGPQAACSNSASSVCFDARDGRIVYRGAREYMPRMNGLSAESVSVRHNAIVFKYSFE
ncbi:MAG TPA: hypothetical protein VGI57_10960 [Usitatibacter sp.]|jgi:hypothetical protein